MPPDWVDPSSGIMPHLTSTETAYLQPYLAVSPSVSLLTSTQSSAPSRSIGLGDKAGPVEWLDEASKRLPPQLIRTLVQPRTTPVQRSASRVVRARRRVFWERAAAGKMDGVEERLAEEVSLRSLRLQDPSLFARMLGSLRLQEIEPDQPGRVEGLPPADGDASGEGAEERGAAFTRYLRKLDLEEAEIRLDAQMSTEAEEDDDENDEDEQQHQPPPARAQGRDQEYGSGGAGKQEFMSIMADRFVHASSEHISQALYDVVDFDDAFDPPTTTMFDEDSYWNESDEEENA